MGDTPVILYGDPPPFVEGQWIWGPGDASPRNAYLHARRAFRLEKPPRQATLAITADSRYQLFVNGTYVGRGPARCDRLRQEIDSWNVTLLLHAGPNVVAVLVHHLGESTFSYQKGRAGLLAELAVEEAPGQTLRVGTDDSWRVLPGEAWVADLDRMSLQLGFPEIMDRRREPRGWTEASFDDKQWPRAVVIGPPGVTPWLRLHAREIPPLAEHEVRPMRLLEVGESRIPSPTLRVDMLGLGAAGVYGVGFLHSYVHVAKRVRASLSLSTDCSFKVWCSGRPLITREARHLTQPCHEIVQLFLEKGWSSLLIKLVGSSGPSSLRLRFSSPECREWVFSSSRDRRDPSWLMIASFACPEPRDPSSGLGASYPPEELIERSGSYGGLNGATVRWHKITPAVSGQTNVAELMAGEILGPSSPERLVDAPAILRGEGSPAAITAVPDRSTYLLIDFGKQVAGHPRITITQARGGEIADIGYAEVLEDQRGRALPHETDSVGRVNPLRGGILAADRLICAPGPQVLETFERRSFRYLQLAFRNCIEPLGVESVTCRMTHYPVQARGRFRCSDELLQRIWDIGAYTVQLNMEDAYTNSPWRERAQRCADARVEALVNQCAFGDVALARRGLRQIARSQDERGFTRGVWPTDSKGSLIPDDTLVWVLSLCDHHLYSGDVGLVAELLPYVARALEAFKGYRDSGGLLKAPPGSIFIDWADVERREIGTCLNALYVGALRAGAALAQVVGEGRLGETWNNQAEHVAALMREYLVDPERGLLRDGIVGGAPVQRFSQHANALAVLYDVLERSQWSPVLDFLEKPPPDAIVPGTPYFTFYVLSALERAGRHAAALEAIRRQWGQMLEFGATTWWEQWNPEGSHCHGWSAGPTYLLSAYVLGVRPTSPGFGTCVVNPSLDLLEWAEGTVPTPHGEIHVRARHGEKRGAIEIEVRLPDGVRATLVLPFSPSSVRINGHPTLPPGVSRDTRSERHFSIATSEPLTFRIS
ncbi:MAG: family 78 glycoside hydrolase catalytic domain [Planctomycetota bacterium]